MNINESRACMVADILTLPVHSEISDFKISELDCPRFREVASNAPVVVLPGTKGALYAWSVSVRCRDSAGNRHSDDCRAKPGGSAGGEAEPCRNQRAGRCPGAGMVRGEVRIS